MATNIGGIEATLETNVRPFLRSMDQAEGRMDKVEDKTEELGDSVESTGLKIAAIGAAISAAFGLAAKAADEEAQVLGRVEAAANITGNSYDSLLAKISPVIDELELFGNASRRELLDIFQQLLIQTNDVDAAMEAMSLSVKLAAEGSGDVTSNATAMTAALSGNVAMLGRLDRSFGPIILKWQELEPSMGKAAARAAAASEIFAILRERAAFAPGITPWQRFAIAADRVRLSVGRVVTESLGPFFQMAAGGLEILKRLSETGLGGIVIKGLVAAGVIATLGGGLVLLGSQALKAWAGLKLLLGGTGALVPLTKALGANLVRVAVVGASLETGLRIANVLNDWEGFRVVVQRVFAALSFGAEKIKGFFGKGNQQLAMAYWDIASGKVAVGQEVPKTLSLLDLVKDAMAELNEAGSLIVDTTAEQVDIDKLLEEALRGLADAENALNDAKTDGAETSKRLSEEERARRDADLAQRRSIAEEDLMLQLGQHEEVLRLLKERRDQTIAAINVARLFEGEARVEQLEELASLNGQIGQLQDQITPKLVDPWDQALEAARNYGGGARGAMSALQTQTNALADTLVNELAAGTNLSKIQFGEFAAAFLKQIAIMITQALILAAIMSVIGGGSFGANFIGFFSGGGPTSPVGGVTGAITPPNDDPLLDAMMRREGSRISDLVLEGMAANLSTRDTQGRTDVGREGVGRGVGNTETIVEVHEATPQTWWQTTDRYIEPRLRERDAARTSET